MESLGLQHYKEQSINTMTQNELLLLLYDELVKRLIRCGLAMEQQEIELMEQSADRCMDILRYLDDTLDPQYEISRDLHRLYDYYLYELNRVKMGRNKAVLDRITPMIQELRDSFREADKRSAEEK